MCVCTGQVQRCGMSPLCVPAVDVVVRAQLLDASQAALLGGVQQGGVASQQVLNVHVPVPNQVQRRVPVPVLPGGVGTVLGG